MAASAARLSTLEVANNILAAERHILTHDHPSTTFLNALYRPTLLFDQDGVLAFLTESIMCALNSRFGTKYIASEMTTYWIEQVISTEQSKWLSDVFFHTPVTYANLAPDLSGIAALNALYRASYHTVLSSDRPVSARQVTDRWLERWRALYSEIYLHGRGSKDEYAKSYGRQKPLILFDDNPTKWLTVARPGVEVWSPSRPWTPANWKSYDNVWVFDSWDTVLERLGVNSDVPIPSFSTAVPANHAHGSAPTKGGR